MFPALWSVGLGGRAPVGDGYCEGIEGRLPAPVHLVRPVPVGLRDLPRWSAPWHKATTLAFLWAAQRGPGQDTQTDRI